MSVKSELNKIEKRMASHDDAKIDIRVNWRDDDLYEWPCEDGSMDLITRDEFIKRGGVIVEYSEDEGDQL